jgi:hypothetical protein
MIKAFAKITIWTLPLPPFRMQKSCNRESYRTHTHRQRQTDRQTADITLLRVFLRHDLCSSIEACTNSSIWSNTSLKNVVLSDFFFRHDEDDDATACGADSVSTFTEFCACSLPLILATCRFSFACKPTQRNTAQHNPNPSACSLFLSLPFLLPPKQRRRTEGRTEGRSWLHNGENSKPGNDVQTSPKESAKGTSSDDQLFFILFFKINVLIWFFNSSSLFMSMVNLILNSYKYHGHEKSHVNLAFLYSCCWCTTRK